MCSNTEQTSLKVHNDVATIRLSQLSITTWTSRICLSSLKNLNEDACLGRESQLIAEVERSVQQMAS